MSENYSKVTIEISEELLIRIINQMENDDPVKLKETEQYVMEFLAKASQDLVTNVLLMGKIEMAKKLLELKIPISIVYQVTDLPVEFIEEMVTEDGV